MLLRLPKKYNPSLDFVSRISVIQILELCDLEGGNSVYVCLVTSVMSNSLRPYELYLTRLLCPWDSPGKNSGVGCHALLQGIILTQPPNQCLLHFRCILYHWATSEALLVLPLSSNKSYSCSESPWTNNIDRLNVFFSPFIHKSVIKKG